MLRRKSRLPRPGRPSAPAPPAAAPAAAPIPAPRPARLLPPPAPREPRAPPPVPPVRPACAAASKRLIGWSPSSPVAAGAGVLPVAAGGEAAAGTAPARSPAPPPRACACSCSTLSGMPYARLVGYTFSHLDQSKRTVSRYSTARSGLLKAALIARSISALGNPMFSIFAIASSRCDPRVSAEGSLKVAPSANGADGADGAGEGVAGAFTVGPVG